MPVATTAGHIHVGAPGAGGPVVVNFVIPGVGAISNDYAFSGTFGCSDVVNRPAQGINSCEDFEQAMLLNNTYANVHSTANPRRRNPRAADQTAVIRRFNDVRRGSTVQGFYVRAGRP